MIEVIVSKRTAEAEGIVLFELVPVGGGELPPFTAGAHVDVHLPGGLIRQYSLCNDPVERTRYQIAVLREPESRGGSQWLHDMLRPGDRLTISEPRNHFELAPHSPGGALLLAGGIGVTPIVAMAQTLARTGQPFEFHYCSRTQARMALRERIENSPFASQSHLHFDEGPPEQKFDAARVLGAPVDGRHVYVCGPKGFIGYVLETAQSLGWPAAQVHREYFAGAEQESGGDEFEIELRSTGRVIRVAAGQSASDALIDAGVDLAVSCQEGVCGTCMTRVLEGIPDHRDMYLTDEEHARNDCFTPCCSRAKTRRLVVDL